METNVWSKQWWKDTGKPKIEETFFTTEMFFADPNNEMEREPPPNDAEFHLAIARVMGAKANGDADGKWATIFKDMTWSEDLKPCIHGKASWDAFAGASTGVKLTKQIWCAVSCIVSKAKGNVEGAKTLLNTLAGTASLPLAQAAPVLYDVATQCPSSVDWAQLKEPKVSVYFNVDGLVTVQKGYKKKIRAMHELAYTVVHEVLHVLGSISNPEWGAEGKEGPMNNFMMDEGSNDLVTHAYVHLATHHTSLSLLYVLCVHIDGCAYDVYDSRVSSSQQSYAFDGYFGLALYNVRRGSFTRRHGPWRADGAKKR